MTEFIHRGHNKKDQNLEFFNVIARRYDFLNHFLSLGIDRWWRRQLVYSLPEDFSGSLLDVATGTGDLAFAILKRFPELKLTGLDNTPAMLVQAHRKMVERGIDFETMIADAEQTPFETDKFSALAIAFGLRNIGNYNEALQEFFRILQPGGRLLILEFNRPESRVFGVLYSFYFHRILPLVGAVISGSKAYHYLPESVDNFPDRSTLHKLITGVGFSNIKINDLTFGVVTLITAKKPTN